jgi:[ribosomal protein S5]-alanine N-acetyltransferase
VPRRLSPPEPPLADDLIRLTPLAQDDVPALTRLVADDDVMRFTLVPSGADSEFVRAWIGRYEQGWADGTRAGFGARSLDGGAFLGFAAIVHVDLAQRQGEIGYAIAREARGQRVGRRAVERAGGLPARRRPALAALQGRPPHRHRRLVTSQPGLNP